jgi:hypothetical protein
MQAARAPCSSLPLASELAARRGAVRPGQPPAAGPGRPIARSSTGAPGAAPSERCGPAARAQVVAACGAIIGGQHLRSKAPALQLLLCLAQRHENAARCERLLPLLVALLQQPVPAWAADAGLHLLACQAIRALIEPSSTEAAEPRQERRAALVLGGAVPALARRLAAAPGRSPAAAAAAACLRFLALSPGFGAALLRGGCLPLLVRQLRGGGAELQAYLCGLLWELAADGGAAEEMLQAGAAEALLAVVAERRGDAAAAGGGGRKGRGGGGGAGGRRAGRHGGRVAACSSAGRLYVQGAASARSARCLPAWLAPPRQALPPWSRLPRRRVQGAGPRPAGRPGQGRPAGRAGGRGQGRRRRGTSGGARRRGGAGQRQRRAAPPVLPGACYISTGGGGLRGAAGAAAGPSGMHPPQRHGGAAQPRFRAGRLWHAAGGGRACIPAAPAPAACLRRGVGY